MNAKSIVLSLTTVALLTLAFSLLIVCMVTDSWRGNSEFRIQHPLTKALLQYDIHHGLWYSCTLPDGSCEKITSDDADDDTTDDELRGNATRGLLAASIFFVFLSLGLLSINIFVKKKLHRITLIIGLVLQICGFITGMAAMINFVDYFKLPNTYESPWTEYRYSYKLGWAGSVLVILPIATTIAEIIFVSA